MKSYTSIDQDIILLNFEQYFKTIELPFINDCVDNGLFNDESINFKQIDVRHLFYHHVIHKLCEIIINFEKKGKKVFILPSSTIISSKNELTNYCDVNDIEHLLLQIIKKVQKKIPVPIIFADDSVEFTNIFKEYTFSPSVGEEFDFIHKVLAFLENNDNLKLSYKNIKSLAKTYKLTFLSEKYFETLRTRELMSNFL